MAEPLAYFITFRTYGTWLPGDARGYVDRNWNEIGTPTASAEKCLEVGAIRRQRAAALVLDEACRATVTAAIQDTASHRGWSVLVVNVRTNHVHVVISAPQRPEPVMTALKAWATRRLVESGLLPAGRPVWSRHGSTRWLWTEDDVRGAAHYVIEMQ